MISFSIYQYSPILPRFINIYILTLLSLTLTTRFIDLAKRSLFSFITKERFYISQQYFLEKKKDTIAKKGKSVMVVYVVPKIENLSP